MKEQNLTNRTVWSREVLKGSLEGLIIALLLFRILFNVVVVSGPSMVPTLADNSVILTNHIKPNLEFESIVVCNSSGLDENIVKRIIGCPGDTIDIDFEQGVVYRNGMNRTRIPRPTSNMTMAYRFLSPWRRTITLCWGIIETTALTAVAPLSD